MPTYQYACTNPECGNEFEVVQSFTDPAVSICPICSEPVRKVFSAVGVVFKGSGFYRTDSRSDGKAPKSDSAPKKESASSETSTSSSKSTSSDSGAASPGKSGSTSGSSGSSGATSGAAGKTAASA